MIRRRTATGITLIIVCASSMWALARARSGAQRARYATLHVDTLATLELPIVLHIGASSTFRSPEDMQLILAEIQRIYDRAKMRIVPRIAMDTLATDSIDIYYRPRLAPNGVSHGRNAREIEVRDTVNLRRVADERPERIALPPHQLALPHRQDVINLEATGTTGWTINARAIITMRTELVKRFNRNR